MSRIVLIGATGGVGSRLGPLLVEAGHQVVGLHRNPEQAEGLREAGLEPLEADLTKTDRARFEEIFEGADAVVFSAGASGAGADLTEAIDGEAAIAAAEAAEAVDARHFYLVSVFPEAGRDRETSEGFEHYMRVKKRADVAVTRTGLDWVLVRPGTLTDETGSGNVRAGYVLPYGDVSRDNVAAFIAGLIENPDIRRDIFELTDGDTPVAEAVGALHRGD